MAILTKGIFGPITGRLGNLVFCICANGTNYVRTIPNKTKKAPTLAQLAQREKFRMAVQFLNPLKDIVKKGFRNANGRKGSTPMGLAMSTLLRYGIVGEYPSLRIDFPEVQLSMGSAQRLLGAEVKRIHSTVIVLSWVSMTNRFTSFEDDRVEVIVYNVNQDAFVRVDGGHREDEALIIKMTAAKPMDRLVFYTFTENRAGDTCGQYVGECVY